jgi:hypothetical protein
VRTTLTLDDDLAARLKAEARRSGRPFKSVVNEYLRAGLAQRRTAKVLPPFRIEPRNMGGPMPGVSFDDIGGLMEAVEDVRHA